ncbi:BgTH12-04735 [Blumeria graminis f. sp. triticale]|uniref:Bgt-2002 n=3 Tax=Blumeria graminis TaxID=34373 RepID=A0A381L5R9_BLUGR|nr:hypothetical protein BGT96224_2002 [Blumeria graminis f. sp. tritici 96224]CAD6499083.1 BgTH12-04735 [Blumeria graminis f. sp. triticale]VCU39218.1 Bgt-2002 [Blumeria graminis f. sp. tritici]
MNSLSRYLRIPRPTRFLAILSLCTGVEMVCLSMIFNKITGFYGLLAILAGLRFSILQLIMYLYSCITLLIVVLLLAHLRKQSPFQCILFAYFYVVDTIVSTVFTSVCAASWFLTVRFGNELQKTTAGKHGASGFSNIGYNMSENSEDIKQLSRVTAAQEAVAYGVASATASSGSGFEETVPSMALVVALTLIRFYFVFVVLAYARQVIRLNSYGASFTKLHLHTDGSADAVSDENPFAVGCFAGDGWKGKMGRIMVKIGESYWLGEKTHQESWAQRIDSRFRPSKFAIGPPGTIERERRARSGTGPPAPASILKL